MADIQKNPLYILDEPAIYNDFSGGINTDPSNENLLVNELRDALNMHYTNATLQKRPGGKILSTISSEEDLKNIQGVFLFSNVNTYIVVMADGKLFSSLYSPSIFLRRMHIAVPTYESQFVPHNQFNELQEYTSHPPVLKHEGFILKGERTITVLEEDLVWSEIDNAYVSVFNEVEKTISSKELILQNHRKVEAASYNNKLYIATGTRFVEVFLNADTVSAQAVEAYHPSGVEAIHLGLNRLSPYPLLTQNTENLSGAATQIHGIIPVPEKIQANGTPSEFRYKAVMTYAAGSVASDYLFCWEILLPSGASYEWAPLADFKFNPVLPETRAQAFGLYSRHSYNNPSFSRGTSELVIPIEWTTYKIRCSFASSFKKDTEGNLITEHDDWVVDRADGFYYGSALATYPDLSLDTDRIWREIQSCTKILADGNKMILYSDAYNSGNWFKTVINNPGYILDSGCLNFKTNKNEEIVKAVHFKGAIAVFSYSKNVGGNIAIVTGNGDDISDDYYSPYRRSVVNSQITTDNPHTVQVAENMLLFKYKDTIHYIEGSELNTEIISVHSANDRVKMHSKDVKLPWKDNDCISEITEDYYAILWKAKSRVENGEVIQERPAMRVKMYYKQGFRLENTVIFPWLRDTSELFNAEIITYIDGTSVHLYRNLLVVYDDSVFTDLGELYPCVVHPRAVDANYPKLVKILKSLLLYYHRGQYFPIDLQIEVNNEAGHQLLPVTKLAQSKVLKEGDQVGVSQLDSTILDSRVLPASYGFPALLIDMRVTATGEGLFSLSSYTLNYLTTNIPAKTIPYHKLIRRKK